MIRFVYSLIFYLLTPLLLIRLWYRGRRAPEYRKRLLERFGVFIPPDDPIDIWLHAVSLGEVIASIPLIEFLLEKKYNIAVTTMTPTGSRKVLEHFKNQVFHVYLPFDMPVCVKGFLKRLKPKMAIIMETELWPNIIHYCNTLAIPLFISNARLSQGSHKGYRKIKFLMSPLLKKVTKVVAQSQADGERFCDLGLPRDKLVVLGNIKFDVNIASVNKMLVSQVREKLGEGKIIIIAASTHHDEEKQLLDVYSKLKAKHPQCVLLIAPRHPERFEEVYRLCSQYRCVKRSDMRQLDKSTEIVLIDSLGELLSFYQVANLAFVGGSLIAKGGHNMLEPMALNTPVITGPYLCNFKHITEQLLEAKAMIVAKDCDNLLELFEKLIVNPSLCQGLAQSAHAVIDNNQGVVKKYARLIMDFLNKN